MYNEPYSPGRRVNSLDLRTSSARTCVKITSRPDYKCAESRLGMLGPQINSVITISDNKQMKAKKKKKKKRNDIFKLNVFSSTVGEYSTLKRNRNATLFQWKIH